RGGGAGRGGVPRRPLGGRRVRRPRPRPRRRGRPALRRGRVTQLPQSHAMGAAPAAPLCASGFAVQRGTLRYMATASTSYRLNADLKRRLAARAAEEGITETALVTRTLEEGLRMARFPRIVFRDGPTGRRAGLSPGPDVVEVIMGVRHERGSEDAKIRGAADQMDL